MSGIISNLTFLKKIIFIFVETHFRNIMIEGSSVKYYLVGSLILLLAGFETKAQQSYNDWVNYNQEYFKIQVAKDGIYRVYYDDLDNQTATNLTQVALSSFQLFHKGEEKPIDVYTGQDGNFNSGDYIEFFGEKNRGELDEPLYENPGDQPHEGYSLYTDSAAYFLTWQSGNQGLRYRDFKETDYQNYTPKPYYNKEVLKYFTDNYFDGLSGTNAQSNLLGLSYYNKGEGWGSSKFDIWNTRFTTSIRTENFANSGPNPQIETQVYSQSRADSSNYQPIYHHHYQVEIGPNQRQIFEVLSKGYNVKTLSTQLNRSDLNDPNTSLSFQVIRGTDWRDQDVNAVNYIKIQYPSTFNLNNEANRKFSISSGLTQKQYLKFSNYESGKNNPVLYDRTSNYKIYGTTNGSDVDAIIPQGSNEKKLYLTDSTNFQIANPRKVNFVNHRNQISSNTDFLIISNKKLQSSAQEYANYRSSKGFNTSVVYTDQLFNQYYYGVHHPLAIKNFIEFLVDNATAPDYLLLLGKGYKNDILRREDKLNENLVPTMGIPPSDNLFAAGLNEEGLALPFSLSRIPAKTNGDVRNYLDKLRTYETQLEMAMNNEGLLWRKQLLHLVGGTNKNENAQFTGFLNNYESIASGPKLGAKATTISKNSSLPQDLGLVDKVLKEINSGLPLVTYFGHGAADILEVPIGEPSDYRYPQGGHPIFLFSGCILGNSFTETSKGENFLLSPNKGAIAWIAETSFSFVGRLNTYTTDFYNNMVQKNYGNTLGTIVNGTIEDFQNPGDPFNEMQILQKTFQGDPAINLYHPSEPDYGITKQDAFITPDNANVEADSFAIGIIAKNKGQAINDSFKIEIKHTFPDFSTETLPPKQVKAPYHKDTFYYYIKPDGNEYVGNNKFEISLDARNKIPEVNEINNTATIEYFLPSSGVFPLFPRPFSIVNERNVTLKVQSNNLFLKNGVYEFQLDTTPQFNSPLLQSSSEINSGFQANWSVSLPLNQDTTVYYWRARLKNQGKAAKAWRGNSFTFINNSPKGWAQADFHQFKSSSPTHIALDSIDREFKFNRRVSGRYLVSSAGVNSSGFNLMRYEGGLMYFSSPPQGILMIAVNPTNQVRFNYPSPYNPWNNENTADGTPEDTFSAVYKFDWITNSGNIDSQVVEDFIQHVDSIPDDYHVFAYNGNEHRFADLGEEFYQALEKLGASEIRSVGNGHPYIMFGRKGYEPGEAEEFTYNENSSTPPDEQTLTATKIIFPVRAQGTLKSAPIGPAQGWGRFDISTSSLESPSKDSIELSIIGIDRAGNENILKNSIPPQSLNIDWIDAEQYPYIRIKASMFDQANLTPPQLNNWRVLYDQVPEGTLKPDLAYNFHQDTLQQGDSLEVEIAYENISDYEMDSLLVHYQIKSSNRKIVLDNEKRLQNLKSGENLVIDKQFSSDDLKGDNNLQVSLNPNLDQLEQYFFNNILKRKFHVNVDQTNPLVDVTFNGRRIMNGDIVEPQPEIRITAKDENQFYLLQDTSNIDIYMKKPDQSEKQRLSYQSNQVEFQGAQSKKSNKAYVTYQPQQKLKDGMYELSVQAKDESGNKSGNQLYKKEFEVVNKSSITHFYPYPNPFTSRMRFVFTLTGSKIPDKINIQILTVTGKVIKEFTKEDLGPLHIGVNKTDYIWRGKDDYGDPVGNGVYFYRVKSYLNGESIEHRETAGDKFFEKNIGKIYLMR